MKDIELINEAAIEFPEDVDRICKALASVGLHATFRECERLWQCYSDSMAAGWMKVPEKSEDILDCIEPYYKHDAS